MDQRTHLRGGASPDQPHVVSQASLGDSGQCAAGPWGCKPGGQTGGRGWDPTPGAAHSPWVPRAAVNPWRKVWRWSSGLQPRGRPGTWPGRLASSLKAHRGCPSPYHHPIPALLLSLQMTQGVRGRVLLLQTAHSRKQEAVAVALPTLCSELKMAVCPPRGDSFNRWQWRKTQRCRQKNLIMRKAKAGILIATTYCKTRLQQDSLCLRMRTCACPRKRTASASFAIPGGLVTGLPSEAEACGFSVPVFERAEDVQITCMILCIAYTTAR